MNLFFIILVVAVWTLICFYAGVVLGIKETKRRYNIPQGEEPIY